MEISERKNLKNRCNFCNGALYTVDIKDSMVNVQIKVKKIKRVCRDCSMEFIEFVFA